MTRRAERFFIAAAIALIVLCLISPAVADENCGANCQGDCKKEWVGPYPPLHVVYKEIEALKTDHPGLVDVEEIGKSVRGKPILVIHIGRKDGVKRPEALITANIHAEEVLSSRVAMGVAKRLVEGDGNDPWITSLLDRIDFWIIPIINVDGYDDVIRGGGKGLRKNADGVDLNRNFPVAPGAKSHHPLAGNHRPRSNYYMGPNALSEPETKAIAEFVSKHKFFAAINGHTVAGKFLYPHCYTKTPCAHHDLFVEMGETFADAQRGVNYRVQMSYTWYPTLGDLDDYLYMHYGIMSVTVEYGKVGKNLKYALRHPKEFWIANPHDAEPWVQSDSVAVLAAIEAALEITDGKPFDPDACRPVEPAR